MAGHRLPSLRIASAAQDVDLGPCRVVRTWKGEADDGTPADFFAAEFEAEQPDAVARLAPALQLPPYMTDELRSVPNPGMRDATEHTLDEFHDTGEADLFGKCRAFGDWVDGLLSRGVYQRLYRVTATSGLDNHISAVDLVAGKERGLVCFDSNSYLGLHRHPRVIEAAGKVLRRVGYGTSSAQLLAGTSRYLRELEDTLSQFHGRESTMVFPTGFAANLGAIHALIRGEDAVVRDRYAHASIHEGCRSSAARYNKIFGHNNHASLAKILRRAEAAGCKGKLVITDGVFSMHGDVAPLPELVRVCREHGARLMVDDAHGIGVIGDQGGGIEEHFDMLGEVDVLMGTLSKALGGLGGYVTGSRELIHYLRWFAPSGLFTTSLPAPLCAGLVQALRIVREEPEHRERLWRNIHYLQPQLEQAGFVVSKPESPIMTVFIGAQDLMWQVSCELFDAGIKCGSVMYPAVGKRECILRILLNANHTLQDLDYLIDNLIRIGAKYGVIDRVRDEVLTSSQSLSIDCVKLGLTGS